MKTASFLLILAILFVSTPLAFAQTNSRYEVGMLVSKNKDTKEENSTISFTKDSFTVISNKKSGPSKELNFADVKAAEYSYSKKPMWKTGVVTALFIGVFAAPFFFIKTKSHWMTVRTDKDFVVLKMERDNYRQIIAEFETHNVKVETVTENDVKKDKDGK